MKIEQETSSKEQGMKRWELALAVFQKTLTVPCKALIMPARPSKALTMSLKTLTMSPRC